MGKIFVIANQKGGVGKSTTVVNVGASLALLGKKVLIVDFDPQAHSVSGLGIEREKIQKTVYDLLIDETTDINSIILDTELENLKIIPSNIDLSGVNVELADVNNKYFILKDKLARVREDFDYILIDTPPHIGFLTLSSLSAADQVLIPLQAEYYALEGISELLKTVDLVKQKLNSKLSVLGIVLTMYDVRTNLSVQVLEEVSKYFKEKLFKTIIPRNVKLSEAPSFGKPACLYQPSSVGAVSYMELSKEILQHG
jgi:chromosome partitioning protein